MRKVFFTKFVNMAKQLLNSSQTTLHCVKTALKNLFPLWNIGKKKVKLNLVKLMQVCFHSPHCLILTKGF